MRAGEGPGQPGRAAGARAAPPALDRGVASALRRLPVLVDRLLPAEGPADSGPSAGAQPRPLTAAAADELHEVLARLGGYLDGLRIRRPADTAADPAVLKDSGTQSAVLRVTAVAVRRSVLMGNGSHSGSNGGGASGCCSNGGSASGGSPGSISSGSPGAGANSGIGDSGSNARSAGAGNEGSSGNGRAGGDSACGGSGSSGSKHGGFTANLAQEACSTACGLLGSMAKQSTSLDFAHSLLRMQTLQCLACRFAEAAAAAEALTAEQLALIMRYSDLAHIIVLGVVQSEDSATTGPERFTRAILARQLLQALNDSSMLEHWARLLLLLQQRPTTAGAARDMAECLLTSCQNLYALCMYLKEQGDAATSGALRRVLSAPCVQHAVLVHGVAALCAADGGAAYGLPEGVWSAALSGCTEAAAQPGGVSPLQLRAALVYALQAVLSSSNSLTPVGTRVAVHMLLRLGRLVVASSGGGWTVELQSILQPVQPAGLGVVVPQADVGPCMASILSLALNMLFPLLVAGAPDWVAEAGADGWRLVVAAMSRSVLRCAISSHRAWLGTHMLLDWVVQFLPGKPLPSATPPLVAAVLAGGLLPCLERLLRLAAEEPLGPESEVVVAVLGCERACHLWTLLLAYGEPRQAAALVATVGKLLRRAGAGAAGTWVSPVTNCASGMLARSLWAATSRGQEPGPPEQLTRLLMFALRKWLPELARIALQPMVPPAAPASAQSAEAARFALHALLAWLPLLLLRCGRDGGGMTAGAATVVAADVAAGSSAACDAGDWLRLLLEDVHVLPLLGGALRLALPVQGDAGSNSSRTRLALAASCCLVAATWLAEVRRAASSLPACPSAWPPELLRALVPGLRESDSGLEADGVLALAELLEVWAAGGGGGGGGVQEAQARERFLTTVSRIREPGSQLNVLASAVAPPAEAHELLRTCAYRGCTRLAGDSEAGARLQACGRCGAAWYCSRECQLSHWREGGHKEACAGAGKVRPG